MCVYISIYIYTIPINLSPNGLSIHWWSLPESFITLKVVYGDFIILSLYSTFGNLLSSVNRSFFPFKLFQSISMISWVIFISMFYAPLLTFIILLMFKLSQVWPVGATCTTRHFRLTLYFFLLELWNQSFL